MIDYGTHIRLWESDAPLFMQGTGSYLSSYSHWMKWNLPDLSTLEHPRGCVPTRAWLGYLVRNTAYDADYDHLSVLWTNSNVSWTSASSLATLQAIYGETYDPTWGYAGDLQVARKAKRIASNETGIVVQSADDMPTANETLHFFDVTGRVQQIYLANNLGACQMTTRHAWGFWEANSDTSASQVTLQGSETLYWLRRLKCKAKAMTSARIPTPRKSSS